jgi:flagellar biosynthesis/type III secretory pathway protein FliH
MKIIRGEKVKESLLLTATRELFNSDLPMHGSFFEEECHKAFEDGIKRGEELGYEKFVAEAKTFLDLLTLLAHKLLDQKKKLLDQLKPEIVEFSMHVCERILRKELSQPESMAALINSLLNLCAHQFKEETLHVFLAPEDLGMLEGYLSQMSNSHREIKGVSFQADTLIRRGDCRIEAKAGLLNYSISRELADLQAKILQ